MRTVSALYVDPKGPYPELVGLENCWDAERDARLYSGHGPVVAHPPCGPWGTLSHFCTKQDAALGPVAVAQVQRFGGVLEHPAHSRLWRHCSLWPPGSLFLDKHGGFSVQLEQVRWGHKARKRTWLYIVGVNHSDVGAFPPHREPTHLLTKFRMGHLGRVLGTADRLPKVAKSERHMTPPDFAAWLVDLASRCRV